jgi:hypothetical protein
MLLLICEIGHEPSCLDADNRLRVWLKDDRSDVKVVLLGELSRTQSVIAVVAGAMMLGASGIADESGDSGLTVRV